MQSNPEMNPFEQSMASRKRGADDDGADMMQQDSQEVSLTQQTVHGTAAMPVLKRRMTDADAAAAGVMNGSNGQADMHSFDNLPHHPSHTLSLYNAYPNDPNHSTTVSGTIPVLPSPSATNAPNGMSFDAIGNDRLKLRHLHMPSYASSSASGSASLDCSAFPSPAISTLSQSDSYAFSNVEDSAMDLEDMADARMLSIGDEELVGYEGLLSNQMHGALHPSGYLNNGTMETSATRLNDGTMETSATHLNNGMMETSATHPSPHQPFASQHPMAGHAMHPASYDAYNGSYGHDIDDGDMMAARYTGQEADVYANRLEGIMGHA